MTKNVFPSTRYQGSKQKFVDWIWQCIKDIPFHTVLDAFGGTGSIAYKMKDRLEIGLRYYCTACRVLPRFTKEAMNQCRNLLLLLC